MEKEKQQNPQPIVINAMDNTTQKKIFYQALFFSLLAK